MGCAVGYGHWARGTGPLAVQVSKKSARAISTDTLADKHMLLFQCANTRDDSVSLESLGRWMIVSRVLASMQA